MKTISAAMQSMLATNYGSEPVCIIEIQWLDEGQWHLYASKDIVEQHVSGNILSISSLESIIKLDSQGQSQQISISLSDTAGILKNIIDNHDIHNRPCRISQWVEGLPLSEKFMLFEGQVVSDIEWSEGDRTLSFEAITKSQDKEVGFSPEQGDFYAVPKDKVGVAWPLVFGFVQNVPAAQIQNFPSTRIQEALGKTDPTLANKIARALQEEVLIRSRQEYYQQLVDRYTPLVEMTPSDTVTIAKLSSAQSSLDAYTARLDWLTVYLTTLQASLIEQNEYTQETVDIGDSTLFPQNVPIELNINGVIYTGYFDGGSFIISGQELSQFDGNELQDFGFTFLEGGTIVKLGSETGSIYVANIISSSVKYIRATKEGVLTTVPADYYTVESVVMGPYTVTLIKFDTPLSDSEGWSDDIYVTLESNIGPNTVDIMEWLISTYTDLIYDTTTFDYVKGKLTNYPSHFALNIRPNIMSLLEDIAFQARCAIWLIQGVFYLKYLPEEVIEVDTITESDVDKGSIKIFTSPSEDLVTKLIAEWQEDGRQEEKHKIILRKNVDLYGIHERTINFFIYNIPSLVKKSATFWLIRFSHIWKNIQFSTCLHKLTLETFDTVKFDFNVDYIANSDVKGLLTEVKYDVAQSQLFLTAWLPVKFGTMEQYNFAWPSTIDSTLVFVMDEGQGVTDNIAAIPTPKFDRITTYTSIYPSDEGDDIPKVRFEYEAGEPPETKEREIVIESTDIYPGQVISLISGSKYNVDVYEKGLFFASTSREVEQLEPSGPYILPGTWTLVARHTQEIKSQILFSELQQEAKKARDEVVDAKNILNEVQEAERQALLYYQRSVLEYETSSKENKKSAGAKRNLAKQNYQIAINNTAQAQAYWEVIDEYATRVEVKLIAVTDESLQNLWSIASGTEDSYTTVTTYTMQAINVEGEIFPGKITSGSGDTYDVDVYKDGLQNTPTVLTVTQLQIVGGESIPIGTWTFVTQRSVTNTVVDLEGNVFTEDDVEYTMQVPVWL